MPVRREEKGSALLRGVVNAAALSGTCREPRRASARPEIRKPGDKTHAGTDPDSLSRARKPALGACAYRDVETADTNIASA